MSGTVETLFLVKENIGVRKSYEQIGEYILDFISNILKLICFDWCSYTQTSVCEFLFMK